MKMQQLMAAIQQHNAAIPPGAVVRWAFLVTFDELAELVHECQADKNLGLSMTPKLAEDIKDARALWHVNGTPIMPELTVAASAPGN